MNERHTDTEDTEQIERENRMNEKKKLCVYRVNNDRFMDVSDVIYKLKHISLLN